MRLVQLLYSNMKCIMHRWRHSSFNVENDGKRERTTKEKVRRERGSGFWMHPSRIQIIYKLPLETLRFICFKWFLMLLLSVWTGKNMIFFSPFICYDSFSLCVSSSFMYTLFSVKILFKITWKKIWLFLWNANNVFNGEIWFRCNVCEWHPYSSCSTWIITTKAHPLWLMSEFCGRYTNLKYGFFYYFFFGKDKEMRRKKKWK